MHADPLFAALCSPHVVHGGTLIALFLAGAAGSVVHCGPMCGGFVLGQVAERMTIMPVGRACGFARVRAGLLTRYQCGRLTTYAMLGGLAGGSAGVLDTVAWLRLLPACLLGLGGVALLLRALRYGRHPASGVAGHLTAAGSGRRPGPPGRGAATAPRGFSLGLMLGLLPCGFLYGAAVLAAATGSVVWGAASMVAFGLGTVPMLVMIGVAGQVAARRLRAALRWIAPAILTANGVLLLLIAARAALLA